MGVRSQGSWCRVGCGWGCRGGGEVVVELV